MLPVQPQLALRQLVHPPGPVRRTPGSTSGTRSSSRNGFSRAGQWARGRERHLRRPGGRSRDLGPSLREHRPVPLPDGGLPAQQRPRGNIYQLFAQVPWSPRRASRPSSAARTTSRATCRSGSTPTNFDPEFGRRRRHGRPDWVPSRIRAGLRADRDGAPTWTRNSQPETLVLSTSHRRNGMGRRKLQYALQRGRLRLVSRARLLRRRPARLVNRRTVDPPFRTWTKDDIHHTNAYLYTLSNWPEPSRWTLGVSGDLFDSTRAGLSRDQVNPKVGVLWTPVAGTTFARRVFRTLKRSWCRTRPSSPLRSRGSTSSSTTSTAPTPGATASASTRSSGHAQPSAGSSPPAR